MVEVGEAAFDDPALAAQSCALARRRPWNLAREIASLDVLSQGRAAFGAGLGCQPEIEFGAFGENADAAARAAKLDEDP